VEMLSAHSRTMNLTEVEPQEHHCPMGLAPRITLASFLTQAVVMC
jgi:hypothetical protein